MEVGKTLADSVAIAFKRMDTAMAQAARVYRFEGTRPTGRGVTPMLAPPSDGRARIVISDFTNATGKREFSAVGRDGNQSVVARPRRYAPPTAPKCPTTQPTRLGLSLVRSELVAST